jgi:hypothetical protein
VEIKGKVHCFFEQSGTFKNEFKKLGYDAYDYDIQNNFGQTDFVIDLFAEIEKGYMGGGSVFSSITTDDLIIAFFPCIYFETIQQLYFALAKNDFRNKPKTFQINYAIDRLHKRTRLHELLYKLAYICYDKGLRLIIENPATAPNYLITGQNFPTPTIIDNNRMIRGDYFKKPTAYWFINCENTYGFSYQNDKEQKIIDKCKGSKGDGLCSEERSMISSDYARNFICDFILGKEQEFGQLKLF